MGLLSGPRHTFDLTLKAKSFEAPHGLLLSVKENLIQFSRIESTCYASLLNRNVRAMRIEC